MSLLLSFKCVGGSRLERAPGLGVPVDVCPSGHSLLGVQDSIFPIQNSKPLLAAFLRPLLDLLAQDVHLHGQQCGEECEEDEERQRHAAGADVAVAGSFVFGSDDPAKQVALLKELAQG